jgi:hypothetical protein
MSIVKLNNRGVRSASAFGSITGLGSMIFIKKQTASSSSTISFVDGTSDVVLDDTYKEYLFTFNNIHPATDGTNLTVGFRDGGTDYDATKTSSFFWAYHGEDDASILQYSGGRDVAQSTAFDPISSNVGNGNDECVSGTLHLFNPSSTTFVKHYIARTNAYEDGSYSIDSFTGGYCNTASAIDGVQFKMASGNIDAGDICLYGIA